MGVIRNITIVVTNTGKRIGVEEIANSFTAVELIEAISNKINLPVGTRGIVIRILTRKQLLSGQTLKEAGIEDGETLEVDYDRTAGGYIDIDKGKVRIETTLEETPYLAEILREIHRIQTDMATLNDKVTSISAEIKEIWNSTIVIGGNHAAVEKSPDNSKKS
jgi:uncharacterized ubiquitin-like protein YukD